MLRPFMILCSVSMCLVVRAQFGPGVLITDAVQLSEGAHELLSKDVDGDGDIDLVLRQGPHVLLFDNADGQGSHASPDTIFFAEPIHHLDMADVDGDDVLDMVMIIGPNSDMIWISGLGNGQFDSPQLISNFPNGAGAVLCHDVQPDPGAEVMVTANGRVYIYAYDAPSGIFTLNDSVSYGGGPPTPVLMAGDVDLDGDDDILSINWSGFVAMGVNNGPGEAWTSSEMILTDFGYTNGGMDLLDVDGDGDLDIVDVKNVVKWARNRVIEDGAYGAFDRVDVHTDVATYGLGWAGPLGCGSPTSLIWHGWPWAGPVQWNLFSEELDAFAPRVSLMDTIRSVHLSAADLNGDGRNDLIIADRDTSLIWWFPNEMPQSPPNAEVVLTPFDTLCASGSSYTLAHAVPAGGQWNGPGVVLGESFTPPGSGTFPLVYAVADSLTGCPISAAQSIIAVAQPTITVVSGNYSDCDTSPLQLAGWPSGGTWTGTVDANGYLDKSCSVRPIFGEGYYDMNAVNGGMCMATTEGFNFPACTPIDLGPDRTLCKGQDTLQVTVLAPFMGASDLYGFDLTATIPPSSTTGFFYADGSPGVYTLSGMAVGAGECEGYDTLLVTVVEPSLPSLLTNDLAFCANEGEGQLAFDMTGNLSGAFSATAVSSVPVDPGQFTPGYHPFLFEVVDANGCEGVLTDSLLILTPPVVTFDFGPININGGPVLLEGGAPAGGAYWFNGSEVTLIDPGTLVPGESIEVLYIYTDNAGCTDTAAVEVDIVTGVGAGPSLAGMQVFPNPATGQCTVLLANRVSEQVRLIDALGRTVRTQVVQHGQGVLDLHGLAPGTYTVLSGQGRVRILVQ